VPVLLPLPVACRGVLQGYLCTCQATLRVQFAVCLSATCLRAAPVLQRQRPVFLSPLSVCLSATRAHAPQGSVSVSVTLSLCPRPARGSVSPCHCHAHSSSAHVSHSDSHTPQDSTRPHVPVTRPHRPQTTATPTCPGPVRRVSASRRAVSAARTSS